MKLRIEAAVGGRGLGGLNKGNLYEIVHRLARDGLITTRTQAQEGPVPDRSVHRITDAGREHLIEWLAETAPEPVPLRDEFVQRVLAASLIGPDEVHKVCSAQRSARLSELKTLQRMRRERANMPAAAFAVAAAIHRIQADLETIEEAERHAGTRLLDASAAERPAAEPPPQRAVRARRAS